MSLNRGQGWTSPTFPCPPLLYIGSSPRVAWLGLTMSFFGAMPSGLVVSFLLSFPMSLTAGMACCSLNAFMRKAELPQALRARLRDYFRYRRSMRSLHDCPALLQAMSPALRAQVAAHTQAKWVNTVPFFRLSGFPVLACRLLFILFTAMKGPQPAY